MSNRMNCNLFRSIKMGYFKDMVKSKKEEGSNHAKDCDDESYLDPEGNSMSPHEFS